MRKPVTRVLLVVATAALVVALSATALLAATAHAVRPPETATATKPGQFSASAGKTKLTDGNTKATVSCASSSGGGDLITTSISGTDFASVTSMALKKCTGPLGVKLAAKQVGSWLVSVSSYDLKTGTVTGYISNVKVAVTAAGCAATVTGSVDVSYARSTGIAKVGPVRNSGHALTVSGVSGCSGLLHNGDSVSVAASYKIT